MFYLYSFIYLSNVSTFYIQIYNSRQSVCRVPRVLCRVFLPHGKHLVSGSVVLITKGYIYIVGQETLNLTLTGPGTTRIQHPPQSKRVMVHR